jgi:tRNA 2-thiocytidine biosynthesis protein TtcA
VPIVKSTCPMDGHTKRQDMKELLENIYKTYPSSKENFLLMLHNQKQLDLWVKKSDINE